MEGLEFTTSELQLILDYTRSWKAFQDKLGLNGRHLTALKKEHPTLSLNKLGAMSPIEFADEIKRCRSIELFGVVYGCKSSEIRRFAEENNINLLIGIAPLGSKTGIGRKGELYFKGLRGQMIVEDCFQEQSHTHPYDFKDLVYGLVNVKTASRKRYQAKCRQNNADYWHFHVGGAKDCDWLAFVPLDRDGKPIKIIMAKAEKVAELFPHGITLTGNDLKGEFVTSMQNDRSQLDSAREYMLFVEALAKERVKEPIVDEPAEEVQSVCEEIPE